VWLIFRAPCRVFFAALQTAAHIEKAGYAILIYAVQNEKKQPMR
jgi:hypothetical protein